MTSLYLFTAFVCLGMSFLFSGMEAGVFALSRLRVRRLMRQGKASARTLHGFLARPEDFLWTIFVGNTTANFTIATLVVLASRDWLRAHPLWFAAAFAAGVLVFCVACELLPKMIFRLFPNRLCLLLARPFTVVHWLLRPLVAVVRWLAAGLMRWSGGRTFTGHLFGNRDELRQLMQESAQSFSTEERGMIERVLDLQSQRVGNVMTPMAKVVSVDGDAPVRDAVALCRERGMSRLPVWSGEGAARRVAGLFSLWSMLYSTGHGIEEGRKVSEHVRPAAYLDADMKLDEAMRHLQRTGQRLAIVLSPERRELGVVSLQDILKAVFGQVRL